MSKRKRAVIEISGPAVEGEIVPRQPVPGMPIAYFNPKGGEFSAEVPAIEYYVRMVVREGSVRVTGPSDAVRVLEGQRKAYLAGVAKKLGRKPKPEPEPKPKPLGALTVAELEAICDDKKIDRSGLRLKADLIDAIKNNGDA
jgi:hypothetical protein